MSVTHKQRDTRLPTLTEIIAADTAKRLGVTAGFTARQIQLIRELAGHGWRFAAITGDPVRYIMEVFVPDPQPGEWDWLDAWYREHPEILDAAGRRSQDQVYAEAQDAAAQLETAAAAAVKARDFTLARQLIDAAEYWWWRDRQRWAARRDYINRREGEQPPPTEKGTS